jgi:hypothetical protein
MMSDISALNILHQKTIFDQSPSDPCDYGGLLSQLRVMPHCMSQEVGSSAGPAGSLIEVDLPCRRNEWHGSF